MFFGLRNRYHLGSLLIGLLGLWAVSVPVSAWPSFDQNQGLSGTHAPAVGKLLVAMPSMKDPRFNNAVILLLRYDAKGATGLVINRPTRLTLATEFDEQVSEQRGHDALFWGGPVAMNGRWMLVEQQVGKDSSGLLSPLLGRLYIANSVKLFEDVLKQDPPLQRFRIYAGYAGWGVSQLEHEIVRGDWIVMPGNVDLVLQPDTESIWPQLIHYRHGQMALLKSPAALEVVKTSYSMTLSAAGGRWGVVGFD